ncbi:MAG: SDR family oxidoreductase [Bacteroidetes bacterium]|nr:SDR family oxidoreductase [Bacteroidota bacterium]
MRILIIGSEGFIGSHLVRYFSEAGNTVYGCGIDAVPASQHYTYFRNDKHVPIWEKIFSNNQFDICINAAGNGDVNFSIEYPAEDFKANTFDTFSILEAIRKYNDNCRYLHISSAAVYGNPEKLPVSEDAACKPLSPYGWHKLMAENICREYSTVFHVPVAVVRPFSVYGPGLKKQVFWDIYRKYLQNTTAVELWGTGSESRDFIYIDDLVRSFDCIIQHAPMNGEIYNIASGEESSVKDVVNVFFESMNLRPRLVFNSIARKGNPLNWRADISKIKALGFTNRVSIESGIKQTATWLHSSSLI